jgi:hypothetical protein
VSEVIELSETSRARMLAWVEALESDEYEQGTGYLEFEEDNTVYHCCLGVLCRVAMADGLTVDTAQTPTVRGTRSQTGSASRFAGSLTSAPQVVLDWLLSQEDLLNDVMLDQNVLIRMNDILDRDFRQIAAYLRETYSLNG